jgi:hypothetical protein
MGSQWERYKIRYVPMSMRSMQLRLLREWPDLLSVIYTNGCTLDTRSAHTVLNPSRKQGLRLELHSKHAITSLPISFMVLCPVEAVLTYEDRRTWRS